MKRNKLVVIGSGRLGATIAAKMSEKGEDVIIVDLRQDSFRKLRDTFSGYQVIGDATDIAVLEDAFIKEAETVVIATNYDNVNIFIAHVCSKILNVPRIVVRLSDADKGELLEGDDIQIIYPFNLSLNAFIQLNERSGE
ncbi:MAG: potassium channel family protein [Acholeplasmataceae bacterium]